MTWKEMFDKTSVKTLLKMCGAEYTESSLQEFMKSDFMQDFADECSNALKKLVVRTSTTIQQLS